MDNNPQNQYEPVGWFTLFLAYWGVAAGAVLLAASLDSYVLHLIEITLNGGRSMSHARHDYSSQYYEPHYWGNWGLLIILVPLGFIISLVSLCAVLVAIKQTVVNFRYIGRPKPLSEPSASDTENQVENSDQTLHVSPEEIAVLERRRRFTVRMYLALGLSLIGILALVGILVIQGEHTANQDPTLLALCGAMAIYSLGAALYYLGRIQSCVRQLIHNYSQATEYKVIEAEDISNAKSGRRCLVKVQAINTGKKDTFSLQTEPPDIHSVITLYIVASDPSLYAWNRDPTDNSKPKLMALHWGWYIIAGVFWLLPVVLWAVTSDYIKGVF